MTTMPPSPWSWLPPEVWTCVRCLAAIITREAAPRCPRCHYREGLT
jgi:hypothetical protein